MIVNWNWSLLMHNVTRATVMRKVRNILLRNKTQTFHVFPFWIFLSWIRIVKVWINCIDSWKNKTWERIYICNCDGMEYTDWDFTLIIYLHRIILHILIYIFCKNLNHLFFSESYLKLIILCGKYLGIWHIYVLFYI